MNQAAGDTIKGVSVLENALDTTHEVVKLIKCDAAFQKLKAEI